MNLLPVILSTSFNTPETVDSFIVNYFNGLGIWGNFALIALSLIASVIFGGFIGLQREKSGHSAGFRTHILISLGSALIMILSIYGVSGEMTRDPMRLAAACVSGVGFLGAGSIIKNGATIKGLTTAATIWVTMSIGMAAGAGYFTISFLVTIITLLCLVSFQKIEIVARKRFLTITLTISEDKNFLTTLMELLNTYSINYSSLKTNFINRNDKKLISISFMCKTTNKDKIDRLVEEIKAKIQPEELNIK